MFHGMERGELKTLYVIGENPAQSEADQKRARGLLEGLDLLVVQDIFLKVFRHIGGFKGESALKTWIFKIAFSEILNRLRWWKRRHRYATMSLDEPPNGNGSPASDFVADAAPTPEEVLQSKERENAIQQALGRLSHEHRSIIVLRDIEGFSYNEIADVLGISMGTVKSRLARARGDLKQSLMRYLSVRHL